MTTNNETTRENIFAGGNGLIVHGKVITPTGVIEDGYVQFENGRIVSVGESSTAPIASSSTAAGAAESAGQNANPNAHGTTVLDAQGQWLVPGFVDHHVHGGDGFAVMDATVEALRAIGRFHASHGTTAWLPTTVTAPFDDLAKAVAAADEAKRTTDFDTLDGAEIVGVHLEGPMISPKRIGAQNPDYVAKPSIEKLEDMLAPYPGLVRKMTIAPELEGSLDVIRWLVSQNIIVSMGHTDATYEEVAEGVKAGARHVTHLYNAMRGFHHREAGTAGAALAFEEVQCELIADGHHVAVPVMKLTVKIVGPGRILLITDAIAAAGRPDGAYDLGGLAVTMHGGVCLLTGTDTLAGSTLTLDEAVKLMVEQVGVPLPDVIRMASTNPGRELGLNKGQLVEGFDADLVLLDGELRVSGTWVRGRQIYTRSTGL